MSRNLFETPRDVREHVDAGAEHVLVRYAACAPPWLRREARALVARVGARAFTGARRELAQRVIAGAFADERVHELPEAVRSVPFGDWRASQTMLVPLEVLADRLADLRDRRLLLSLAISIARSANAASVLEVRSLARAVDRAVHGEDLGRVAA